MKKILVAVDLSEATAGVCASAAALAKATGAELWVLHVAEPDPSFVGFGAGPASVRHQVAVELREEHREVQHYADDLRAQGIEATALLVRGPTLTTLLAEADKLGAELIVAGTHGRGALMRTLQGSVSTGLVHHSKVPVLVIPTRPEADGSETSGTETKENSS